MSANLYNVHERVKQILTEEPETRNSDELLISKVDIQINPAISKLPYFDVMQNRKKYGLPSCESVRRCRQKVQASNPELKPTKKVKTYREEMEQIFEDYARSKA